MLVLERTRGGVTGLQEKAASEAFKDKGAGSAKYGIGVSWPGLRIAGGAVVRPHPSGPGSSFLGDSHVIGLAAPSNQTMACSSPAGNTCIHTPSP